MVFDVITQINYLTRLTSRFVIWKLAVNSYFAVDRTILYQYSWLAITSTLMPFLAFGPAFKNVHVIIERWFVPSVMAIFNDTKIFVMLNFLWWMYHVLSFQRHKEFTVWKSEQVFFTIHWLTQVFYCYW